MIVYKLRLFGEDKVYWLTKREGTAVMKKWEAGNGGVFTLGHYGLMANVNKIREIRQAEETEPFPQEFKDALIDEGGLALPEYTDNQMSARNLPTENVLLSLGLKPIESELSERGLVEKHNAGKFPDAGYYSATVHYRMGEAGKEYLLDKMTIPRLLEMRFDEEEKGYPPYVVATFEYGVKKI